jgi:hypothetical protein
VTFGGKDLTLPRLRKPCSDFRRRHKRRIFPGRCSMAQVSLAGRLVGVGRFELPTRCSRRSLTLFSPLKSNVASARQVAYRSVCVRAKRSTAVHGKASEVGIEFPLCGIADVLITPGLRTLADISEPIRDVRITPESGLGQRGHRCARSGRDAACFVPRASSPIAAPYLSLGGPHPAKTVRYD